MLDMLTRGFSPRPGQDAVRVQEAPLNPRAALRQAQVAHAAAVQVAQAASAAAGRGRAAVGAAQEALAPFAGLDGRVAAYQADQLRAGDGASGGLPADLAKARRRRAELAEALADAEGAAGLLAGEAQAASAGVEAAVAVLHRAADDVALAEIARLADEARAATQEAARLRASVSGFLASRTVSDQPVPWPVVQLTHDPVHAHMLDIAGPSTLGPAVWSRFRVALARDADVVLPQQVYRKEAG